MELVGRGVGTERASGIAVLMPARRVGIEPVLPESVDAAESRIRAAIAAAAAHLRERAGGTSAGASAILSAQALLVEDPALADAAREHLHNGVTPEVALAAAGEALARELERLGGALAERADDLEDAVRLVIAHLQGRPVDRLPQLPPGSILIAEELRPHEASRLDPAAVVGVVVRRASPSSHTSLILAEFGIPAVVGCGDLASIPAGAPVTIDPAHGTVFVDLAARPSRPAIETPGADSGADPRSAVVEVDQVPAGTSTLRDGTPVRLFVNLGSVAAAERAARMGAEGIGLLRSELLFLDRSDEPSVAEQTEVYTQVFSRFAGRRVVARLFDCDAEKPLPFLGMDERTSAALGVRGIRLLRANEASVFRQLEALRAAQSATGVDLGVVAPMVADIEDAEYVREICREAGVASTGAHIEVPSAALLVDELLENVDFVSVGTNDLLQFLLAADRHLGVLARYQDQWHPALLRMIAGVVAAAARAGMPAGICGNAAADPRLAAVLVGLGVRSLSMPASAIAPVRERLATVTRAEAEAAAQRALAGRSAAECRALAFPA